MFTSKLFLTYLQKQDRSITRVYKIIGPLNHYIIADKHGHYKLIRALAYNRIAII